jgi:hypothetical protein
MILTLRPRRALTLRRGALALGALALAAGLAALVADIRDFDRTRGGYEPPFADVTGEPIDWSTVETTPTGMLRRGRVLDFLADCTSGMIAGRILGVEIPFRPFSDRAIAVHRPREACEERGFLPQF